MHKCKWCGKRRSGSHDKHADRPLFLSRLARRELKKKHSHIHILPQEAPHRNDDEEATRIRRAKYSKKINEALKTA